MCLAESPTGHSVVELLRLTVALEPVEVILCLSAFPRLSLVRQIPVSAQLTLNASLSHIRRKKIASLSGAGVLTIHISKETMHHNIFIPKSVLMLAAEEKHSEFCKNGQCGFRSCSKLMLDYGTSLEPENLQPILYENFCPKQQVLQARISAGVLS